MWNDLRQVDLINYSDLYDKDPELVFPNPVISFYIQLLVTYFCGSSYFTSLVTDRLKFEHEKLVNAYLQLFLHFLNNTTIAWDQASLICVLCNLYNVIAIMHHW